MEQKNTQEINIMSKQEIMSIFHKQLKMIANLSKSTGFGLVDCTNAMSNLGNTIIQLEQLIDY